MRVSPCVRAVRGVRKGDHVEVMQENVGSGGAYHELRNPTTGHRGLYPKVWVQAATE